MSDTIIQIKRSATTASPANLQPGELAYSSNGEILYIGSATGSNTANIIAIAGQRTPGTLTANQAIVVNANGFIDVINTNKLIVGLDGETANITSLTSDGTLATASNTQLATSWAIKDYVDNNSAAELSGLNDVDVSTEANNNILVYDAGAGKWENHTISGTANEVDVSFSGQDITVGLPTNVIVTTSLTVGNSTVNAAITATAFDIDGTITGGNTTITGFANVTSTLAAGNTTITGFANVIGTLAAGNTVITGTLGANDTTITGFINVSSSAQFDGSVALGSNTSDTISINGLVNTDIIPSANVTSNIGNTVNQWLNIYANNVQAGYATFEHDVSITGNLNVTGSVVTINVDTFKVVDPLIHLASNNETSDTLDIGFVGHYSDDGGSTKRHTGFFRDATDGVFKVFTNLTQTGLDDGDTTVDTANASYTTGTIEAYLLSGGLSTNTSTIAITANSTVNVAIIANTLTLSTALGVASGGIGLSSVGVGSILYGNSTDPLVELSVGSNGQVLQITNNLPAYGGLDGGTF